MADKNAKSIIVIEGVNYIMERKTVKILFQIPAHLAVFRFRILLLTVLLCVLKYIITLMYDRPFFFFFFNIILTFHYNFWLNASGKIF